MHYKLDLGIDHVLIDEAQDTSDKQWEIVRRLVAEFTAGKGAREVKRTIFAVGDEKQSIFSFQDAAPKEFADDAAAFRDARTTTADWISCSASSSTRSARARACSAPSTRCSRRKGIAASVTADTDGFPPHIALPDAPPSVVEIWEPEKPDERKRDRRLGRAVRYGERDQPAREAGAADRAHACAGLSTSARRSASSAAPRATAMCSILVRQRGPLFEAIIRALKNENVEVAGADRLVLTEHIAVMDLMALADALLLPEDDLALAAVLRSPLFGFSDEDLFAIAWDRGRSSLRAALARKAAEREKFAAGRARGSTSLREAARRKTPFALLCAAARRRRRPAAFPRAGSAPRPTMRSTNSSISRSITSGARRLRCRALSPGCAQRAPR